MVRIFYTVFESQHCQLADWLTFCLYRPGETIPAGGTIVKCLKYISRVELRFVNEIGFCLCWDRQSFHTWLLMDLEMGTR